MDLETSLASTLDAMGTNLDQASPEQLFCALLRVTRDVELKQKPAQGDRKLYYFSAEFLIGRLLRANLMPSAYSPSTGPHSPRSRTASPSPRSATAGWGA